MTSVVYPPRRADDREAARARTFQQLAFGCAVFMLLMYSQGWVGPLSGDKPDAESGGLIRALYYPAYIVGLGLIGTAPLGVLRALVRAPVLILLVGLAAASITWSDDPSATFRRVVAIILTTLSGVVIAARFDWRRLSAIWAWSFLILAVGSLIVCVAVPSIGRMSSIFPGAWRGLWLEKNALGGNMALGCVILASAAVLDPRRWKLWTFGAVLAVFLVLMSTSKTSLVALGLGLGALGFVWLARRGPAAGVVMVWLGVVGVGAIASVVLFAPHLIFDALGKDATLTGRTRIWAGAASVIREKPNFGWGYGAVWDNESPWGPLAKITKIAGFRARHAHSSWVEIELNLGLWGLVLWALYFVEAWMRGFWSVFTSRGALLALPFLAVYSLTSLTESVTLTWNDLRWVMFVTIAVKLALNERDEA